MPDSMKLLRSAVAALLFHFSTMTLWPSAAFAQTLPQTLSPPEVEIEPNGVNLLTGKVKIERPEISIPAAPRLRYSTASDIVMYVAGEQSESTRLGNFSVHFGGNRSHTFEGVEGNVGVSNSDSSLAYSLLSGGTDFHLEWEAVES
jgi:hypothetical protein